MTIDHWYIYRIQGSGIGERGTGKGDQGTGNGEWGMGNGERGTGNGERTGEQGTGIFTLHLFIYYLFHRNLPNSNKENE